MQEITTETKLTENGTNDQRKTKGKIMQACLNNKTDAGDQPARPRNCNESKVVVESRADYVSRLRNLRQKPHRQRWPDVDGAMLGLDEAYEGSVVVSAWDLVILAWYWTRVYEEYRAVTAQTTSRKWLWLYCTSNRRVCRLEAELALRLNRACDTVAKGGSWANLGDLSGLLAGMADVWNLAPVAGLKWNEYGWVPTWRLIRAVRRAAKLVGTSAIQQGRMARSRMRWRSGRGFEFYDRYSDDLCYGGPPSPLTRMRVEYWRGLATREIPGLTEQTLVSDFCKQPGDKTVLLKSPDGQPMLWIAMGKDGNRHLCDPGYPDVVADHDDSGMPLLFLVEDWMETNDWDVEF